jgi:hypothetical protein
MPAIITGAEYATFINTFRCQPSSQEEVVRINVDIVEQVASTFPGFISAAVHRSTDGTRVFNYLQWESASTSPHAALTRVPEDRPSLRRPDRVRAAPMRGGLRRPAGAKAPAPRYLTRLK